MKSILFGLLAIQFTSCAFIYSGNNERKTQTKLVQKINAKAKDFAKCAKESDIFKKLEMSRVPVTLYLEIEKSGSLSKFQLDNKNYPSEFIDCVFNTVELIQFPKLESHDLIKLEQPFVFSSKS